MSASIPQTVPLMPIDYVFIGANPYQIEFVFYYDYAIDNEKLESALKTTLTDFHLVSSQLQPLAGERYQLRPCPEGVVFRSCRQSEGSMDVNNRYAYLDSVKTREGEPLTKIRLTHAGSGSVLAISISHIVADGFSCFYFLSQLVRAYHGKPVQRPDYGRDWYRNRPLALPFRPGNVETLERTGFALGAPRTDVPVERIVWENRLITQDEIAALQAEAAASTDVHLSKNDVITAHLWRTYVPKWHRAGPLKHPNFALPFDVRRFSDWVSERYFGNGICLASGAMLAEHFINAPLGELALLVRKTVDKVNRGYVQGSYDVFEAFRQAYGLGAMQDFYVADPGDGILVTNLSRVPLEGLDFGQGKPFQFFAATPSPRAAIVLPAENGVKVDICYPFE